MKQIIVLLLSTAMGVIMMSCKESSTNPPEEKPPGYQEDIPWPSLADSPWPMGHHDPQSTGRSKLLGPTTGIDSVVLDSLYITSGIAIASDSSYYFLSMYKNNGLHAYDKTGKIKWRLQQFKGEYLGGYSTPTISKEGNIYFTTLGALYAINDKGEVLWKFVADELINYTTLNMDKEGNIYFVSKKPTLFCVTKNGQLKFKLQDDRFNSGSWISGTSFSPDGKTLYVPGYKPTIFAIDILSQQIKWTFGDDVLRGSPLVESGGNIYINTFVDSINGGKASVFCLNPDGTVRWSYLHNNQMSINYLNRMTEGTIDRDGNYYFGYDTLYSIDYFGKIRWKLNIGSRITAPIISDKNGNIFLINDENRMFSISSKGRTNWIIDQVRLTFSGFRGPMSLIHGKILMPSYRGPRLLDIY